MGLRGLCVAVAAFLAISSVAHGNEVCAFPKPARVIEQSGDPHAKGGRLLQVWEMDDAPVWWSLTEPAGYAAVRVRFAAHAGETNPVQLLGQVPWTNNRVVAAHAADWIRPINCLEMLLQQTQDARVPMTHTPTEFMSVVLRSPDDQRLRVYFYTINDSVIGRATPVSAPATADVRAGWKALGALHNHAFHPGQPELNGPVAPSKPDAEFNTNFAESAGLAEAWITNGLDTARIPASAFGLFERD